MREVKDGFNKKGELYLIAMKKDHNRSSNCLLAGIVKAGCPKSSGNKVSRDMENVGNV
jgi:hypothetical protein